MTDTMVKLAANLSMLFTELPFLDRFAAAAQAGFGAVEFLFPYEHSPEEVAGALKDNGLELVLFNLPAGDWAGGERGLGALPGREAECRAGAALALEYARATGCRQLHLMAGITTGLDQDACRAALVENLRHAADLVEGDGINILLEPINTRVDMPGYFYDTSAAALAVMAEAGRANVKLQYDIYHMEIMEGDVAATIERLLPVIGHMQLADVPGRGEPGTGTIDWPALFAHIEALGYGGWIGCEYRPVAGTVAGLGWAAPYLAKPGG